MTGVANLANGSTDISIMTDSYMRQCSAGAMLFVSCALGIRTHTLQMQQLNTTKCGILLYIVSINVLCFL